METRFGLDSPVARHSLGLPRGLAILISNSPVRSPVAQPGVDPVTNRIKSVAKRLAAR